MSALIDMLYDWWYPPFEQPAIEPETEEPRLFHVDVSFTEKTQPAIRVFVYPTLRKLK